MLGINTDSAKHMGCIQGLWVILTLQKVPVLSGMGTDHTGCFGILSLSLETLHPPCSLSQTLSVFSYTKYLHTHKPVSPLSQLIMCFLFSFMSQQLTELSDDQHPCVQQLSADVFLAMCGVRAEPNKTCRPPPVAQREKVRDSPTQTVRSGVSYLDFWLRGMEITPRD